MVNVNSSVIEDANRLRNYSGIHLYRQEKTKDVMVFQKNLFI